MSSAMYLSEAIKTIERIACEQAGRISDAAEAVAEAAAADRSLFAFGASHSFMPVEEMVYRTGGLMLVNPIYPHGMNLSVRPLTMTSRLERLRGLGAELLDGTPAGRGDVLFIFSTSGRNPVGIDMAMRAAEKGLKTIGITALSYTNEVESRHPSGKKIADICDIVIDNCAPYGDAALDISGCPGKVGPVSSIAGCAIANALVAESVRKMLDRGMIPPVFISANVDGGEEYNEKLLQKNAHRIHYL